MKISKEEIREVVRRVLIYYIRRKERLKDEERILFVIPLYPPCLDEVLLEDDLYGRLACMDFLLEDSSLMFPELKGRKVFCGDRKEDIQEVFRSIKSYRRLEVYSPPLDFLRAVRDGKEENLFVRIALCFLLSGKPVTVRQICQPEKLPEGRFGKELKDMQADLWDMGISFADLRTGIADTEDTAGEKEAELINAETVEKAFKHGLREIGAGRGAVVTPLGMERAKELGVHIKKR